MKRRKRSQIALDICALLKGQKGPPKLLRFLPSGKKYLSVNKFTVMARRTLCQILI